MENSTLTPVKEMPAPNPGTFRIPKYNLGLLLDRIAKLNKRAAKLSCPAIQVSQGTPYWATVLEVVVEEDVTGRERRVQRPVPYEFIDVTVTGESPKLAGWQFVAAIDHEEGGNILRVIPGFEGNIPQVYRTATTDCEHCQIKRQRNHTFVLKSEAGEYKQVGRTCLRDFLGHTSPEAYATWASLLCDLADLADGLDSTEGGSTQQDSGWETEDFLRTLVRICTAYGYTSRKSADVTGQASTGNYLSLYNSSSKAAVEFRRKLAEAVPMTPQVEAKANLLAEWARAIDPATENDFLYNLHTVLAGPVVRFRHLGMGAAVWVAYERAMETEQQKAARLASYEAARELRLAKKVADWAGTLKKREEFTVTVEKTRVFDSSFGARTLVTMRDEWFRVFIWWASGYAQVEEGATYRVKATVTDHGEYKGQKQTTVQRVKILETLQAPQN